MSTESKPMLLGEHTYGYYFPETKVFRCSHGGWSSPITLINDHVCDVKYVPSVTTYNFIDYIPDGWDHT